MLSAVTQRSGRLVQTCMVYGWDKVDHLPCLGWNIGVSRGLIYIINTYHTVRGGRLGTLMRWVAAASASAAAPAARYWEALAL